MNLRIKTLLILTAFLDVALCTNCKKSPNELGILNIAAVTNISTTSATCGGEIINGGMSYITSCGVCWGLTENPTISGSKTIDYPSSAKYVSQITGLTPGTTYYVRAYSTNSFGTGYSGQTSFKTVAIAIPVLTTSAMTSVSSTSAISGGEITKDGGSPVSSRGVCWSTSTGPKIESDNKTSNGTGTGVFVSSLTGLTAGTSYYVRAYATNAVGTAYGNEITFSSTAVLPVVTTSAVSNITATTISGGGNVTSSGGSTVTARGVCWSLTSNPTIALSTKTTDGTGTGLFTSSLTGLVGGTTYYIRAYATNSIGTVYGALLNFKTAALPTVTTTAVTSIKSTSATSGGTVSSDGGVSVTARGVCWSTTTGPTVALSTKTSDGTGTGTFVSPISGLTVNATYYLRSYATNSAGTSYGTEITFKTTYAVGESAQGGIIAYVLQSGDPGYISGQIHGLVAAGSDQSSGIQWYAGTNTTTGATATALGTGNANTNSIVLSQGTSVNYAAKLCGDLVLNSYSDWYLPGKDELNKLYLNKTLVGGFSTGAYCSSSESSSSALWSQNFNTGVQSSSTLKSSLYYVRAIRSF